LCSTQCSILARTTERRRKFGSAGDALAWIDRAYPLKMSPTSRGFVERMMSCMQKKGQQGGPGVQEKGRTSAAFALRILMLCSNISGFMKHNSRVAIAIVAGIAAKLNTDWVLIRRRQSRPSQAWRNASMIIALNTDPERGMSLVVILEKIGEVLFRCCGHRCCRGRRCKCRSGGRRCADGGCCTSRGRCWCVGSCSSVTLVRPCKCAFGHSAIA
jgi:hypothetical protein